MERDPRWEYCSGRSAIRQMFATSSRTSTSGGSIRPPRRSPARSAATRTSVVNAETNAAADVPPATFLLSRYNVSRCSTNRPGQNSASPGCGVTQRAMSLSRSEAQPARAVKYTDPRVSGCRPWVPASESAAAPWRCARRIRAGSSVDSS